MLLEFPLNTVDNCIWFTQFLTQTQYFSYLFGQDFLTFQEAIQMHFSHLIAIFELLLLFNLTFFFFIAAVSEIIQYFPCPGYFK